MGSRPRSPLPAAGVLCLHAVLARITDQLGGQAALHSFASLSVPFSLSYFACPGADVPVPPAAYVWAAWIWLAPLVWVRGWDSYVPEKEGLQGESATDLTSQAHNIPRKAWPVAAHALQHLRSIYICLCCHSHLMLLDLAVCCLAVNIAAVQQALPAPTAFPWSTLFPQDPPLSSP